LFRATALSKSYGSYATDTQRTPFDRFIEQETKRNIELDNAITWTESLIGLADQNQLVDPNA